MTPLSAAAGELPSGVRVWFLSLAGAARLLHRAAPLLAPAERARFNRLVPHGATARRCLCRAVLRSLLGEYLGRPPASLRMVNGPWGKPGLVDAGGSVWPEFNVSHSGDAALIAISERGAVGVDVEVLRPDRDLLAMARLAFTAEETAQLAAVHGEERLRQFYGTWCAKEAAMKADGRGLAMGLARFRVDLSGPRPVLAPALTEWQSGGQALSSLRWRLSPVAVPAGLVGTIAVAGALDGTAECTGPGLADSEVASC